jgi:hypothetical protein
MNILNKDLHITEYSDSSLRCRLKNKNIVTAFRDYFILLSLRKLFLFTLMTKKYNLSKSSLTNSKI